MNNPPKFILSFFRWFCHPDLLPSIEGDLMELFNENLVQGGIRKAKWLFVWDVLKLLRPSIIRPSEGAYRMNNYGMIKNYLKVIIRNLRRKKLFAGINIMGMSLAIAVSLAIYSYTYNELSFDQFHSKSERIVRFNYRFQNSTGYDTHWARVDGSWANDLPNKFSQIEKMIRFQSFRPRDIIVGENKFKEEQAFAVDQEVFDVFDFEFLDGNPKYALNDPFSVVLTNSTAHKYFGAENPIGKEVFIKNEEGIKEAYRVTALIADLPSNTHLPITLLSSINKKEDRKGWAFIYMLLKEGVDVKLFEEDLNRVQQENHPDQNGNKFTLHLQPIEDIHLHSHLSREIVENGSYQSVMTFIGVAILLLILAAANFANLNTVQSLDRSKEAGIRKVMGATASNLGLYFLLEAFVLTMLSLMIGVSLFSIAFPFIEAFIGQELHIDIWLLVQLLIALLVAITLLSGLYPAKYLANYHLVRALKGEADFKSQGGTIRQMLVGIQFVIAIGLISSTLIISKQFNFIQNHDLGYSQEQVMVISENPFEVIQSYQLLKKKIKEVSGVKDVAGLMELPTVAIKDMGQLGVKDEPEKILSTDIQAFDVNTIDLLEIELIAGENFKENAIKNKPLVKLKELNEIRDFLVDRPQSYIINESAMTELGWRDTREVIGKSINWSQGNMVYEYGPIIGVVRDFHQESLKTQIDPLIIMNEPHWFRHILIRTTGENHFDTRHEIETLWNELFSDVPLNIVYLDKEFEKMYDTENKQIQLMKGFTLVALFIAFLGLFGMISFALKTRTKEIAIRKVLGSSLQELGLLFGKEYLMLAIISSIVAVPIIWYLLNSWLNGYAYHIEMGSSSFVIALLILVFILFTTLIFHLVTKATQNPVESLRDE
ncbi:MAG: ABC transporter permease [Reichenbachiella sp.]